jgi:hypothetical protein
MTPAEIAKVIGQPEPAHRKPRLFMTLAPVEMLVFSNLTPAEYAWYATHRPGKVFRQVMFAEVRADARHLVAEAIFHADKAELVNNAGKKTKTLLLGDSFKPHPVPGVGRLRQRGPGRPLRRRSRGRLRVDVPRDDPARLGARVLISPSRRD